MFVNIYLRIMDLLDLVAQKFCILLAGLMTLTVGLQIISRYVMKYPFVWTEELARYLMIWMVFVGASCMLKRWDNIYVDYFINKLKKRTLAIVILFHKFLILGLVFYCAYLCYSVFSRVGVYQFSPAMGISMLWPQSGMIVGFVLMTLQLIGVILDDIFNKKVLNIDKETGSGGGAE